MWMPILYQMSSPTMIPKLSARSRSQLRILKKLAAGDLDPTTAFMMGKLKVRRQYGNRNEIAERLSLRLAIIEEKTACMAVFFCVCTEIFDSLEYWPRE